MLFLYPQSFILLIISFTLFKTSKPMEDLFKKVEMLLSDTGISSKKFWSIHVGISQNNITMFAYYDSNLAKTVSRLADGKLEETGYVKFTFVQYETEFQIVLC